MFKYPVQALHTKLELDVIILKFMYILVNLALSGIPSYLKKYLLSSSKNGPFE